MFILFFVIVFSSMGFGLVLPPFVFVAKNLGASEMFAGFIVSSFAMGQFLATPVWGKLSDQYGRKPILVVTMAASIFAYLLMAWADRSGDLWLLLLSRFLTGLMAGNFAAATAYVADITPMEKRAQGMGMVGGAVSIGFMSGPALGGLLSGNTAATASLFWPSIIAAVMSFVTMLGILIFLRESLSAEQRAVSAAHRVQQTGAGNGRRSGSAMDILTRPVLAQMVLMGFLIFFAMTNFETTFPFWAQAGFDWGPRQVGFCFMYLALIVMITQMFITGRLVPIFGEGKLLLAATVMYMCGLLWMATMPFSDLAAATGWFVLPRLTAAESLMLFGITFTSAGGALFNTASTSWVSKQAGEHERGAVLGLYQAAGWLGRSMGPTVSGFLFMTYGPNTPLFAATLLMLPVFFIVMYIRSRHATAAG
jgi:MFS transporter, DHA1 family, tetracycline resistance protein